MLRGDRPPVRARRGGLRRHLRERPGRAAHRLPVPDRQPARRHRARHGRPLRAGAGLGDLRRRRPDEPLRRQRRRPEDADPAPDPLGGLHRAVRSRGRRGAARDPRDGDQPRARAGRGAAAVHRGQRSAPTRCTTSRSSTCCATGSGRRRSASWRWHAWRDVDARDWPPGFPEAKRVTYDRPRSASGSRSSASASSASPSSSARRCPTGRRSSPAARSRPRGDWRAPSDGTAEAWLDDLERNVPKV